MTPYICKRGSDFTIVIEAIGGDRLAVTAVAAKMKKFKGGAVEMPGDTVVSAASFVIAVLPPSAGFLGGWSLTLPALTTTGLTAGMYLADATLTVAGKDSIDGPVIIEVKNVASKP